MKILTLNKKQQKKLLELLDEFFPDYSNIEIFSLIDDFRMDDYFIDFNISIHIHWYQLCLTELPKRIWSKLQNSELGFVEEFDDRQYVLNSFVTEVDKYPQDISISYKEDFQGFKNYCTVYHPAEFLYDFVKFCKKNKYFKS